MRRQRVIETLASVLIGLTVGLGVTYLGAPSWAAAGFAALAYLVVVGR